MTTQANNTIKLPQTFWWHNIAQFGGAMNDNLFKLLMIYALVAWNGVDASPKILATVGLVFAIPFILIVPIAGNFADKFSKRSMIVILKAAEIGIMGVGVVALNKESAFLLYLTMFLMSAQSAFIGPCKYGIIPEQVGHERLSKANGMLQLFTFVAIIAGTVLAPELSLILNQQFALAALSCLVIAGLGFAASLKMQSTPAHPDRHLSLNGFGSVFRTFKIIRKDGFLVLAVAALAVFGLAAAFIQLNLLNYGSEHLQLSPEQSTRLFLLTAIGIGLGSATAGWLSGRNIEFGIVPIGAGLMSISLVVLGVIAPGSLKAAIIVMPILGFAAGLFIVPLESFIQFRSPSDRVGSIKATSSFFSWIGILSASALLYLNTAIGLSAQQGFLCLGIGLLILAVVSLIVLPDFFIKFIVLLVTRFCYKMKVRGLEKLPVEGGALLVCNHISLMDAVLIASSQQRRIRMLMSRSFYEKSNWMIRKLVDIGGVILIHGQDNPKKLLQSLKNARQALDDGYLVCIFAEGALSRTGMMRPFKPGFERIVKGTDYPIIPVYIGGAWGSVSSYRHGMPKIRPLRDFRYPISVHYGEALPASSTVFEVQQAVSELSVDAWELLKGHRKSLGHEFIRSARRNWKKLALADNNGKELSFGETLTASLLLRDCIRQSTTVDEDHIGVLLPTGIASTLSNLAITLDLRTSVNLNYTAPAALVASAEKQCGLNTVITSRAFLERFPDLPLPANVLYVDDLLTGFSSAEKKRAWLSARLTPASRLSKAGDFDAEHIATVLFSSGSTAEPKGVMLSHHNLLSNIESFRAVLGPKRSDVMLASLPHFHSFGYTAAMWFPLLSGLTTACHTSPLEADAIGKLAERYHGSLLLTTPSFLIAYCRKIKPEQLAALRYVFTGAEKLQPRVADMFEKRFGLRPLEGYGATELAPVCAVSLPNVEIDKLEETGSRPERLGRVLPGIAMKIVHPETGEALAAGEEGMICVKGPNVMKGYLHKPELTASVVKDGWYETGDIGLMDTDGFFAITGRLSRFSKIGGEMISHGSIEKALQDALDTGPESLAVVALEDARKGEKLCVLHTLGDKTGDLHTLLKGLEIPNLWKPNARDWIAIESLPVLGSGKLDYRSMKAIANEGRSTGGSGHED
ncbi:acyl-[ACP]--phospholipid O-acyltransferase [Coraliomargarita parva]|uniref:acyl-[ACP]--phospholipid O-acyltransferase n=1 Tax=Coraliomargarita parva TaxID=3014050 RepID=UPI0022B552A7|nr:acyl-[ACP]--phospholipid O-acyltransferase [Coraliomargarita parva]